MSFPPTHQSGQPGPLLEIEGLTKWFPGVKANDHISLAIQPGEIHTILGENGAGKSTLINLLSGMLQPDRGRILVQGRAVTLSSPRTALDLGIGTVYQHFTLIPNLSVGENIWLGLKTGWLLNRVDAQRVSALQTELGLTVPLQTEVRFLSLGQQQRVELMKVLVRGSQVLLLDEPTSVLTPSEVRDLFAILLRLKAVGVGVVFITHKLDEALEISDRLTILRQGRQVGQFAPAELASLERAALAQEIVSLMFGGAENRPPTADRRPPKDIFVSNSPSPCEVPPKGAGRGGWRVRAGDDSPKLSLLTLHQVSALDDRGAVAVREVNLQLRPGQIIGLAGVDGNGQKELAELIAGQRRVSAGQVRLNGLDLTNRGVRAAEQAGVAYVTDDRLGEGGVADLTVAENMVLKVIHRLPFSRRMVLNRPAIEAHARRLIEQFNIKTPGPEARLGTLSGGNIQKLMLARELALQPKVLICNQPTQGLDVLTAQTVLQTLRRQANQGMAVLLISAELDELLAVSDQLGVMYRGRLLALLNRSQADRETIGRLMLGQSAVLDK